MEKLISGKVFVFDENISTDEIYPGQYLDLTDPEDVAKHAMQGADPNFVNECKAGDIIAASTNFGCGSSREHAAVTLKSAGIGAIVADSFGRIFYRNAINLGIPLVVCPGIRNLVKKGDTLSIDMVTGELMNQTTGKALRVQPLSGYTMDILTSGGVKPMIQKQLAHQGED
jgi:3-isopropylmalate/(R)-2-methylmalate dehydratase small subunit